MVVSGYFRINRPLRPHFKGMLEILANYLKCSILNDSGSVDNTLQVCNSCAAYNDLAMRPFDGVHLELICNS